MSKPRKKLHWRAFYQITEDVVLGLRKQGITIGSRYRFGHKPFSSALQNFKVIGGGK